MIKKVLLTSLLFIAVSFAGIELKAKVDRNTIKLNDTVRFELELVSDVGSLSLPDISGALKEFDVQSKSQSSQFSNVNGKITRSESHIYQLLPKRVGKLGIPSLQFRYGKQLIRSNPLTITVLAGKQGKTSSKVRGNLYLDASLDKKAYYVGEPIIYTIKFYARRSNYTQMRLVDPVLQNLLPFTGISKKETNYKTVENGYQYAVNEIVSFFYAPKPGDASIAPAQLNLYTFFGSGQRIKSNGVQIKIKALPKSPANFAGLIGDFNILASLDKNRVGINDPLKLNLLITGLGDLGGIKVPNPIINKDIELFEPKKEIKTELQGLNLNSRLNMEYLIIPRNSGEFTIRFQDLVYFSPKAKAYKTLKIAPLKVNVKGTRLSLETKTPQALSFIGGQEVVLESKDINFINNKLGRLYTLPYKVYFQQKVVLAFGMLIFTLILGVVKYVVGRGLKSDQVISSLAAKKVYAYLKRVKKKKTGTELINSLPEALNIYFINKLNLEPRQLTRKDIAKLLSQNSIKAGSDIKQICLEFVDVLDRYKFSGEITNQDDDAKKYIQQLKDIVQDLEKTLKRKK
jgi:hypothetical protein